MSRRDLLLGHSGGVVEWIVTARVKVSHGRSLQLLGSILLQTSSLTLTHIITAFISRHKH